MPGGDGHPAAAAYLAAVRDQLGDLEPEELAEVIEDLREHLSEVVAELGDGFSWQALVDRLGPPAGYAAELRAAADIEAPEPPAVPARFGRRLLRFLASTFGGIALVCAMFTVVGVLFVDDDAFGFVVPAAIAAVAAAACMLPLLLTADDPRAEMASVPGAGRAFRAERWLRQQPWGEPTVEYLRSLRPAWWIVRAAALGLVVAYASTVSLGLAVFLVAVVVSVWTGRRTASGAITGRRLWALNGANIGLAFAGAIVAVVALNDASRVYDYYADGGYVEEDPYYGTATHQDDGEYYADVGVYGEDGAEVTNIYPYGPDGELLTGVRLYDHGGRPLELPVYEECFDGGLPEETFVVASPWGSHVYPRPSVTVDQRGECGEPELDAPFGERLPDPTDVELSSTSDGGVDPTPAPSATLDGLDRPAPSSELSSAPASPAASPDK